MKTRLRGAGPCDIRLHKSLRRAQLLSSCRQKRLPTSHGHCWGQVRFLKEMSFVAFQTSFELTDLFLLEILVSLLEPFWPDGTGCARGFLSALDAAWMLRSWSLQVIVSIVSPSSLLSSRILLGCWRRGRTCTACSAKPPTKISTRTSKITLSTREPGAGLLEIPTFSFCVKVQKYTPANER